MATKQQILDYVEHTPLNTNRFVLEQMLDTLDGGGTGGNITADVKKVGNVTTITISDGKTTTTAQVFDGKDGRDGVDGKDGRDGAPGQDGFSPIVAVTKNDDGDTVISVTDKNGTKETVIETEKFDPAQINEIFGGYADGTFE